MFSAQQKSTMAGAARSLGTERPKLQWQVEHPKLRLLFLQCGGTLALEVSQKVKLQNTTRARALVFNRMSPGSHEKPNSCKSLAGTAAAFLSRQAECSCTACPIRKSKSLSRISRRQISQLKYLRRGRPLNTCVPRL